MLPRKWLENFLFIIASMKFLAAGVARVALEKDFGLVQSFLANELTKFLSYDLLGFPWVPFGSLALG